MTLEELTSEAMRIPSVERLRLAEQILASLDSPEQREVDAAWAAEAEERVVAFEQGAVEAMDADALHQAIEKRLGI
ncbi:addiction module protein [Cerasicoccus maritimus]|uniref:addiction module protein n=1 Tax=Cerasicoccus maritimus TaxID=490089 RepID=UPI0028529309|nr:addiction module protein [Cerasicoccus maritimus]